MVFSEDVFGKLIIITKTLGIVESPYGAAEALWAVGPRSSCTCGAAKALWAVVSKILLHLRHS